MYATLHQIDGIDRTLDTGWVDEVLSAFKGMAPLAGALVMRRLEPRPGQVLALWDDAADAAAVEPGLGSTGSVTVGPSRSYEVTSRKEGLSTQPARFATLTTFNGPHSAEWLASYARAGEERVWPAVREVPGFVEHVGGVAADGSCFSAALGESVDALEDVASAIMATELLPGENPAHLSGPDAVYTLRLLHADLPVGASR